MYDSLSAANEARNLAHDEDVENVRYVVLEVHGDHNLDELLHGITQSALDGISENYETVSVTGMDRDGREVIDPEAAQDWQDTLDADGADVQPRFGYPIPAFLKAVAQLGDADDMREDDRTDTLNGIIAWARDFTGLTDAPSPAPSLDTDEDTDEGTRTVIDGLPACQLTCSEAETIAAVLREADEALADRFIREHGDGDDEPEDMHHDLCDPEHVCP